MNQLNITRLILLCEFEFNFSEFTVSTFPLSAGDSFQFQILKRRDKNKNVRGGIKEFLSQIFSWGRDLLCSFSKNALYSKLYLVLSHFGSVKSLK